MNESPKMLGGNPQGSFADRLGGRLQYHVYRFLLALTALAIFINIIDRGDSFENPLLLLLLNLVFYLAVSAAVSARFAAIFRAEGSPGFFLLACGVAAWGFSGLLGVVIALFPAQAGRFDANALITIHNCCIWLAAMCHLAAVILSSLVKYRVGAGRELWLVCGYLAVFLLAMAIALATRESILPKFFVPGVGGTLVRQFVLASTIAMFLLAALLLRQRLERSSSAPAVWYESGLLLMALGLLCIWMQKTTGGWLGWYGRGVQYLGGLFMLMASVKAAGGAAWRLTSAQGGALEEWTWPSRLPLITATGLAGVLVTGAVHFLFLEPTDPGFSFLAFLPAVMFAVILGGSPAAACSFLFSSVLVVFFHYGIAGNSFRSLRVEIPQFFIFLGMSVGTAMLGSALQRSRAQVVAAKVEMRHVLQRRRDAEALRQSAERLANVIEGTRAGTWEWHVETGETVFNERWAEMLGYRLQELAPVSIETWYRLAHPDDIRRSNELLQRVFSRLDTIYDCECRMRHRDGRWMWIHDRGKVVQWGEDGRPLRLAGSHTDITARKLAEERLKALTEEQQAILATIPLCLAKTVDSQKVWLNCKAQRAGQDEERHPADGHHLFPRPEVFREIWRRAEPVLRDGAIFQTEEEVTAAEGERVCRLLGRAIDAADLTRGVIWTLEDITARKNAERRLLESERNFRNIVETTSDLVVVVATEGKILFANSRFRDALGVAEAELADLHLLDLHPAPLRQEAAEIFAAMIRGEREICPLPIITRTGATLPVETRVWLGNWSGTPSMFGFIRDLTADQEERQRFEAMFRHNPSIMAITSHPEHIFVDVNDAFLQILGYQRQEVVGRTAEEFGLFPEPDQYRVMVEELLREKRIRDHLHQVRHRDGTVLQGLFSGEVVQTQGREYSITVMVDLTERIRAEQELVLAKEAAECADAEKSRLLSVIAHEFRTPLALLNSSLDILGRYRERLGAGDIELQEHHIRSAMSQLKSLVDISQSYNWLQTGTVQPQRASIVLEAFIRQVAREAEIAWAKDHRFSVEVETCGATILGDEILLRSILVNLLANAFQYTPAGGRVRLTAVNDPHNLYISVEDDGIGIPPQDRHRVFQPFTRGANATATRGMGLGLSIVALSLEKLHGTIDVASDQGIGTTIRLTFPHPHDRE